MALSTLDDLFAAPYSLRGQRVFVRADLNVPLQDGRVADDSRIRASLTTLRRLVAAGARVVVASHLGRPKGQPRAELSLRPVAACLAERLGRPVRFAEDCVGEAAQRAVAALADGEVLLLENLRFHPGEERNDPDFARALAGLADVYVGDAFGSAHRAHASTVGMVEHVGRAVAGDLLRSEVEHLRLALEPDRPFVCLLGGAKVSDKLAVLEALAPRADVLAVGGAMAYTFLLAQGQTTGSSRVEPQLVEAARRVLTAATEAGHRVLLPSDHVLAREIAPDAATRVGKEIPEGWMGVDIGPATVVAYAEEVGRARTIFWNGPMGVFEIEAFAAGTEALARSVAEARAVSIVGGGDSLAALNRLGLAERITHCSTGGGAALEFVQGRVLPGIAALEG